MNRADTLEFSFQVANQGSESIGGPEGTGMEFKSELGFGLGLTWNFDNNFALSGDLIYSHPRYTARFIVDDPAPGTSEVVEVSHRADFVTGQLRGTWNILDGPVTPFVEGAVGFTHVDSNVADGPPVTGCWWDPWWGYICRDYYSTYSDSNWSYALGGGLRWDVNADFGLRAAYTWRVIDMGTSSDPEFDNYSVDLIWRF